MTLSTVLISVREKTGMTLKEMSDFLGIPTSTYKAYENGRMAPKIDFYELYEDKSGIALRRSEKTGEICYTDAGKKLKAVQKARALHPIAVYLNHTIQDLVYIKSPLEPAFKIIYPGIKPRSICIKTQIGFVICRNISKSGINSKHQYLFVMKDGKEETGRLAEKKIDPKAIYRAFLISNILTYNELTEWIIEPE